MVGGLLDQVVIESEIESGRSGLAEDLTIDQDLERVRYVALRPAAQFTQEFHVQGQPYDRRQLDNGLRARGKPVEAGEDRLFHRPGDLAA